MLSSHIWDHIAQKTIVAKASRIFRGGSRDRLVGLFPRVLIWGVLMMGYSLWRALTAIYGERPYSSSNALGKIARDTNVCSYEL